MKNLQISTNKSGSLLLKLFAGLLLFSHFNLKAQLQAGTIPLNSFLDTASFNHTVEWLNASSYSVQLNLDEDPQSEIGFVISAYLSSLNGPTQYVELSNFDPSISIAFSNSGSDNFTNFIDYGENIDNTLNYSNNGMYVAAATNMIYGGETSATDTFRYIPFRQLIGSNFYRYGWIRLSIAEIAFGYKVLGISWTHFSPSIPLPLNEINLSANNNSPSSISLSWTGTDNFQGDQYYIERSEDAQNFVKIATFLADDNASSLTDDISKCNSEKLYYRITAIDLDQKKYYSNTTHVFLTGNASMSIYPTICTDYIRIQHFKPKQTYQANIYNLMGELIQQSQIQAEFTNFNLRLDNLPEGQYLLEMRNIVEGNSTTFKFIKQ